MKYRADGGLSAGGSSKMVDRIVLSHPDRQGVGGMTKMINRSNNGLLEQKNIRIVTVISGQYHTRHCTSRTDCTLRSVQVRTRHTHMYTAKYTQALHEALNAL